MNIEDANNQFLAVYGECVFSQLTTIVARYSNIVVDESRVTSRMSSIRQSIEYLLALHRNTFSIFTIPNRLKLLVRGRDVMKMTLCLFSF